MAQVGGFRPGAGRKKGGKNQRTIARLAIAEKAVSKRITPLEVMLHAMHEHFAAKEYDAAAAIARDAAPYIHPRLSATKIVDEFDGMEAETLRAYLSGKGVAGLPEETRH